VNRIGIIGMGFVGGALFEGMSHAFDISTYDKAKGFNCFTRQFCTDTYHMGHVVHDDPFMKVIHRLDGPVFVCVPTPMNKDGSCSTAIVEEVVTALDNAAQMVHNGERKLVIAVKSTVPPGTCEALNNKCKYSYVCFNPEFLVEKSAIEDFKNQDRIIVGGPREATDVMKLIYEISYPRVSVTKTSSTIAEMVKYMTNVFLATKVSLANEFKQISDSLGIDYDKVVEYATKDKRLGTSHWAVPGPDGKGGFSGSCFPKDINALIAKATELSVNPIVMKAVWQKNLEVRPERDWELLKGRAIVNE